MTTRRGRRAVRRLLPPDGPQYELFNLAVAFWAITTFVYVLGDPPPTNLAALDWLLGETPLMIWSALLFITGAFATVTSYCDRAMVHGLTALGFTASLWCGSLLVGTVGQMISSEPTNPASFGAVVFYGFVARQAVHQAKEA